MNRELKFSLWDKVNKKWLLKEFSMIGENMMMGVYMQILNDYFPDRLNDLVLVQYTGKKDQDDKDIYENAILNTNGSITLVKYNQETACFSGFQFTKQKYNQAQTKIIGHFFDNPELIGTSND